MNKLVIGILAHVDAGKTTLSEAMLYQSGAIRKLGRVDNQDAYFDTYEIERARGITIFSKQAKIETENLQITLLDTPGHIDFSAEMERTLQVLDYAVLVISGTDGVQGHTKTLWHLLSVYKIPTFIFVNKMDQNGIKKDSVFAELRTQLDDGCIDFLDEGEQSFYEEIAMCKESLLQEFIETDAIPTSEIIQGVKDRVIFPCYFGSALKLQGIEEFLKGLVSYTASMIYPKDFGAKIFKIARDEQGMRLTYMKVTGGTLKVKAVLTNRLLQENNNNGYNKDDVWEEKVNQIRLYSGEKYEAVNEVNAGSICAVTGLTRSKPWERLGIEVLKEIPVLEPVLSYRIKLPNGCDNKEMLPKLRQLEEEEPELHILWNENLQEIQAQVMGEVQIEILKSLILERFGISVDFVSGSIVYKETIADTVEGVGHFEPLRHYAEVHLLMEPLEQGSGLIFTSKLSEDDLDRNWQRLILSHLEEKNHKGVLTGANITDLKITLVAGRAHKKHTEGGDFREATYRAVRQGLRQAESVLLEPYYDFQLEIPEMMVGRAMTDIEKMQGSCQLSGKNKEMALLAGTAPVSAMKNYAMEVIAYTKGEGRLFCSLKGYEPCHNTQEVIENIGYDAERDINNTSDSVFCAHGAGFVVAWDKVKEYMHIESYLQRDKKETALKIMEHDSGITDELWIDTEEIDRIIARTFYANQGEKSSWRKTKSMKSDLSSAVSARSRMTAKSKEEYLLVDGYNIIFAWQELSELAQINLDGARGKLMDLLCNYQAIRGCNLIVVFDAYRISGHLTEILDYHNIHVVYTKEAETADHYIEHFVHNLDNKYNVTVATSDGLEQVIIRGQGCALLSARDLKEEMKQVFEKTMELLDELKPKQKNYLFDSIPKETREQINAIRMGIEPK